MAQSLGAKILFETEVNAWEEKCMCICVGAEKSRERKGQGYNNNDVQVHLGALLEFITALFKYNTAPFFPDQPLLYPSDLWNKCEAREEEMWLLRISICEAGGRNSFLLATWNLRQSWEAMQDWNKLPLLTEGRSDTKGHLKPWQIDNGDIGDAGQYLKCEMLYINKYICIHICTHPYICVYVCVLGFFLCKIKKKDEQAWLQNGV